MTIAQVNDRNVSQNIDRKNMGAINSEQKAKSVAFGSEMRVANFKMGSILPEHDSYKPSQIDRSSSGVALGLTKGTNSGSFVPTRAIGS